MNEVGDVVRPGSASWPTQLEDLRDSAPKCLWVRGSGELRLLALRSVAIVGSRAATPYGRQVASDLAGGLAAAGWVVFSGAAFGIDAAAHRGAMAAGGATVAVLASGVDVPSPQSHASLLERVRECGAVVSERPPGESPRQHSFLVRNRLIAALSRAVVVVEAGLRSGALNTARQAESLGRHLFAVPGPVTSDLSRGTHNLLRSRRAELVTCAGDVLDAIEPLGAVGVPTRTEPSAEPIAAGPVLVALSTEPSGVDDVAQRVGRPVGIVLDALTNLRKRGRVEQTVEGWRLSGR